MLCEFRRLHPMIKDQKSTRAWAATFPTTFLLYAAEFGVL